MRLPPNNLDVTRRTAIAGAAAVATVGLPAAARARSLATLSVREAAWVGAFADALVPGAVAAGFVPFLDRQVSVPAERSLLMMRYLEVAPPYLDFYRAGLAALAAHVGGEPGAAAWPAIVARLGAGVPPGWTGPPAPLFLFAVRADAVDIVYGTPEGFARLGIDYLPHIEPPRSW